MQTEDVVVLGLVALIVWRGWSNTREDSPAQAFQGGIEPVRTGRSGIADDATWAQQRVDQTMTVLRQMGWPATDDKRKEVAISLVAQWAVETDRGKFEWNYNLGGWKYAKKFAGDHAFTVIRNGTTKKFERWEAWPDVFSAIVDHVGRIRKIWPAAAKVLEDDPTDRLWVVLLGKGGYYGESPEAYAKAWEDARVWIAPLVVHLRPEV